MSDSERKSLPERPSLEQLRQQAKDLLRELGGRRELSLADAQLRVARSYEFPRLAGSRGARQQSESARARELQRSRRPSRDCLHGR